MDNTKEFQDDEKWFVEKDGVPHLVGRNHIGVTCHICKAAPSGHKVEEDSSEAILLYQDGEKRFKLPRHPLTAYACCACFKKIMGWIVPCGGELKK